MFLYTALKFEENRLKHAQLQHRLYQFLKIDGLSKWSEKKMKNMMKLR